MRTLRPAGWPPVSGAYQTAPPTGRREDDGWPQGWRGGWGTRGRGGVGVHGGAWGRGCTYGVGGRLLQPLVLRAQMAQGQLGEGSRFGQRWEGLTQLEGRGKARVGSAVRVRDQGPGLHLGWRSRLREEEEATCPRWTQSLSRGSTRAGFTVQASWAPRGQTLSSRPAWGGCSSANCSTSNSGDPECVPRITRGAWGLEEDQGGVGGVGRASPSARRSR